MPHRNLMARCSARSKTSGGQCGQSALLGGTVCYWHGGKAPQVMATAEQRIRALAEGPALARMEHLIDQADTDSVRLAAARDVLDRAGYGAVRKLDVTVIQTEAQRIAGELGIPVEQVYREAGIQVGT